MGAASPRPRGDARDAAQLHHLGHAVHHVGAGRRGRDGSRVPLRRSERDPPRSGRRPLQRRDATAPRRVARASRRGRADRPRADLLRQRGAHARVLRRAGRRPRRLRRDGRLLPQGPGRAPDPGRRPRARAALRACRGRPAGRAAQPLHNRARATGLPRGRPGGVPGAAHGSRGARARDVEPRGRDDPA